MKKGKTSVFSVEETRERFCFTEGGAILVVSFFNVGGHMKGHHLGQGGNPVICAPKNCIFALGPLYTGRASVS